MTGKREVRTTIEHKNSHAKATYAEYNNAGTSQEDPCLTCLAITMITSQPLNNLWRKPKNDGEPRAQACSKQNKKCSSQKMKNYEVRLKPTSRINLVAFILCKLRMWIWPSYRSYHCSRFNYSHPCFILLDNYYSADASSHLKTYIAFWLAHLRPSQLLSTSNNSE